MLMYIFSKDSHGTSVVWFPVKSGEVRRVYGC